MLANKPDDLDNILDATLSRCANIDVPAGLEERILAKLARRKARRGQSIQIAAFVLMTGLFLSALFHPVNSAEIAKRRDQTVQPTIQLLEVEAPDHQPADSQLSLRTLLVAEPALADIEIEAGESDSIESAGSETTPAVIEDSFISDFEVESLSMATLHLSDLSSIP